MNRLLRVGLSLVVVTASAVAVSLPASAARSTVPTCQRSVLARTTSTDKAGYAKGAPVRISTSVTNVAGRTCAVDIHACVSATVTNSAGTVVWSAVPLNAVCALYIVRQNLAPGQAVTRSWTWDQHVCTLIGKCPGPQVAPDHYVAQGHWGGRIGDARPASFTINP